MIGAGCRAHTVRLRARSDVLVRRGATLLEDALHTATTPLPGRVLLVRSLSLGSFAPGGSSASLALRVERRLADVASRAVHATDPSSADAPAVYFRDAAEPYVLLLARIAAHESTDAWFWRITTRHWTPTMSRDEALRSLTFGMLETPAGAAAVASLVGELTRRRTLDTLLASLRWQDGPSLVRAAGWAHIWPRDRDPLPSWADDAAVGSLPTVRRWTEFWGGDDARTAWLAAALLVAERPTLVAAADLAARVGALIERATIDWRDAGDTPSKHVLAARRAHDAPSLSAAPEAVPTRDARTADDPALDRPRESLEPADTSIRATPPRAAYGQTPSEARPAIRQAGVESAGDPDGIGDREYAPTPSDAADGHPEVVAAGARHVAAAGNASVARHSTQPQTVGSSITDGSGEQRGDVSAADLSLLGSTVGEEPTRDEIEHGGPRFPDGPVSTSHAGLFFLLPAMMRLGMGEFLADHPQLLALDFATRLLRDVAERLDVPEADGVFAALAPVPPGDDVARWNGEFVVPRVWRETVAGPAPWRVTRVGERRALTDGSRGLVMGLWSGRAPLRAREIRGDLPLRRTRPLADRPPMDVLFVTWTTALRRWCHQYAGIGLRGVISRAGRLWVTRTHLDVALSARSVDIRVRRAGLDVNPHWLSWLGRVVEFRYEREGPRRE